MTHLNALFYPKVRFGDRLSTAKPEALEAGAVGYKLVRKPSGMHVLYAGAGSSPCAAKDMLI